ncbi:MAG: glycosyltransferase family 4 protein [Oligoflexales bacterium]
MHILHLVPSKSWRGGENQVSTLAQGLLKQGIQTTVATPKDSLFTSKSPHIPLIHLPKLSPYGLWTILKFIRDEKVTHIDVHSSHAHNWGLLLKIFNQNLVLIVHRRVDNPPNHALKYKTQLIDHYVPISEAIQNVLLKTGIPKHRMSVIHSATDSEKFLSIDPCISRANLVDFCNIPAHSQIVGTTAALSPQKGIDTLLEAIAILKKDHPLLHICIAGDGALRQSLEEKTHALKITKHVTFMGWVEDTSDFLSALDIFALPSNNEGLGTSILDAFHAKKCVVATQVGGIPEMVKPMKTGLLVPSKNPAELAKALDTVLQDDHLRQRLAVGGHQLVESLFTKELMIRKNIEIYNRIQSLKLSKPSLKLKQSK